jgi:hypothetical protein
MVLAHDAAELAGLDLPEKVRRRRALWARSATLPLIMIASGDG